MNADILKHFSFKFIRKVRHKKIYCNENSFNLKKKFRFVDSLYVLQFFFSNKKKILLYYSYLSNFYDYIIVWYFFSLKKKINFTTPYKPQERDKEINFN